MKKRLPLTIMALFTLALSLYIAKNVHENVNSQSNDLLAANIEALTSIEPGQAPDPGTCGTIETDEWGPTLECGHLPAIKHVYHQIKYKCTEGKSGSCRTGVFNTVFACTQVISEDLTKESTCH